MCINIDYEAELQVIFIQLFGQKILDIIISSLVHLDGPLN